jgi:hypothetical protein
MSKNGPRVRHSPDVVTDYLARLPVFEERLRSKIDTSAGPEGCWPWMGQRSAKGYGIICQGNLVPVRVHRLIWGIANGHAPGDLLIRHSCDNPPCCNEAHLLDGTPADNTGDMMERSRHRSRAIKGEASPTARLTDAQIAEIRSRRAGGERLGPLAQEFGVSLGYVDKIVSGRVRKAAPELHGERRE